MKEKVIKLDFEHDRYCVCRQVTAREIAAVLENPLRALLLCELLSAQQSLIVSQLARCLDVPAYIARQHLYVMERYLIVNRSKGRPAAFTVREEFLKYLEKESVS